MNTKQLLIVTGALVALSGMFVLLAINGVDTGPFAALLVGTIVPTVTAMFAAKRAGEARDYAKQTEKNTNGNTSRLLDVIEKHGLHVEEKENSRD